MALTPKKQSELPYLKLKTYTVAEAIAYGANTAGVGAIIRVSDGNAGEMCLAISDGVNWKIIGHDDTISTTERKNTLEDYVISLYQDSGRFAGNGVNITTVGAFDFPAYLVNYADTTVVGLAKFVHNNSSYGGTGAALDPNVKDLIDKIRDPSRRRYGVEFWVAKLTMGTTLQEEHVVNGIPCHLSLFAAQNMRPPKLTYHIYMRTLSGQIVLSPEADQIMYKDGVPYTDEFTLLAAEGWKSITIHDRLDPYNSIGYSPRAYSVYAEQGAQYLIACPAMIGGITNIDDNVGVIAGANSWPS